MAPIPIAYSRLAQADDEEAAIRLSMTDDDDKNPSDAPPAYTDDEDAAAPGQSAYKPTTGLAPKLVDDRSSAFKQCMAGGICGLIMVALYFSFLSGGGDWSSMLSNQLFGAGRPCAAHQATTNYAHAIETNARLGNLLSGNEVATEGIDLGRFAKIFERMFLAEPTAEGAREALRRYTNVSHIAGSKADYESAVNLISEWSNLLGVDVPSNLSSLVFDAGSPESVHHLTGEWHNTNGHPLGLPRFWTDTYSVYLNYPINSSLTLGPAPTKEEPHPKPRFVAALKEDLLKEDPTSGRGIPPFHGYSISGTAEGQVVYAALGTKQDFDRLAELNISVAGKVALVRYGGPFRGLKVRAAQEAGAVACLIYSDPHEDPVKAADGYKMYPDGPAREPSSVQRGSVQALSFYPGDPSTPGKPSYRNASRLPIDEADSLPKIPSLPISYADALPLLNSLKGKGIRARDVGDDWEGEVPGVDEYWTGPSEDVAHVENYVDMKVRDIWNTYSVIPGWTDEVVLLGNHRDAWVFGAADPSSGTATVHEIMRGLGSLLKKGWRPLRTIVVASWDAEEYGLVGSTEFGEDYSEWLKDHVVSYHNLDVAVSGRKLAGKASPSLADLINGAAADVVDPDDSSKMLEINANHPLGSGSDYTVMLQYLGIASTDMGYKAGGASSPVYHYHSNYDSFAWMEKFGDPDFKRHQAIARVLGLVTLRASQSLFAPINTTVYASELSNYFSKIEKLASDAHLSPSVNLTALRTSISAVQRASSDLDVERADVQTKIEKLFNGGGLPYHARLVAQLDKNAELRELLVRVQKVNERLRKFERGFIDEKGLPGREWYRHLGVAPGRWLGYGATTFPGITEAFTWDHSSKSAQHETDRLVAHLDKIASNLSPACQGRMRMHN